MTTLPDKKEVVVGGRTMYDVRAFYRKEGRARFISHLDLYRTIQRAFARSKLPVWFTEGFNPHIYLTFALPIALGYRGKEETFDFRLTENISNQEAADRLNAVMPEGIVITAVRAPVCKAEEIKEADYTLSFSAKGLSGEALAGKLRSFLEKDVIETQKRTKKGPKTIDLKPAVLRYALTSGETGVTLSLTLPAGIHENINPTLLTDAFGVEEGLSLQYREIVREKIRCADGTDFS